MSRRDGLIIVKPPLSIVPGRLPRVTLPIRRSPFRMSSVALSAYSSKPSSLDARIIQAFFPERHNCRFGNRGNSLPRLSKWSVVVNNHIPLLPGCLVLSRSARRSLSSRYTYVNPNILLSRGRIGASSSTTNGNGTSFLTFISRISFPATRSIFAPRRTLRSTSRACGVVSPPSWRSQ